LHDLTAHDVRQALTALAKKQSSATVAIAHNALTRAIRHAESRDLVRRNVSALIDTPTGQTGRPSQAMTLEQTRKLTEVASDLTTHRLGAYVTLCLQTGIRTEEARALTWQHVDLDGKPDQDPALLGLTRFDGHPDLAPVQRTCARHILDALTEDGH